MPRLNARTAVIAACLAALVSCKRSQANALLVAAGGEAQVDEPPIDLVVLLVIDQWPSWRFIKDVDVLDGGLARLVSEGVFYAEAEYPYASTFTAPGHALIGTGAPPAKSGILANGWFRRDRGTYMAATDADDYPVFNIAAAAVDESSVTIAGAGASPAALLVEGVADQLRRERPEARAISIGLKQRAAVLMTGRRPNLAIWYDDTQQAMTTGRFWVDAPPTWLVDLAREHPIAERFDLDWDVADPEFVEQHVGCPDDQEGEAEVMGFDRAFPHQLAASTNKPKALRVTPNGTALVIETAMAAIDGERLGQRGATDLLAVTLSSHDYAGHYWGQDSWERFDTLRHIDRQLGIFLAHLDEVIGADRYAVVVTSDHGAVPLIELSVAAGRDARRIPYSEILGAADQGARSVLGPGTWVVGYAANSIYVTDELLSDKKRGQAIDAAVDALSKLPNMGAVAARDEVAGGDCDRHDGVLRFLCESAHPDRSGEILLVPARWSLFIEERFPTGSAHGTPSPEDRMVPLIVRRPGIAARRAGERPSMLMVAPTVANLLGVKPPAAATAGPVSLGAPSK